MDFNVVIFLVVFGCCAYVGVVDIGREIFRSMSSEYGIEVVIEYYGCMVDLFGRFGFFEEVYILI